MEDPDIIPKRSESTREAMAIYEERRVKAEDEAHQLKQELIQVQKDHEKTQALLEQERSFSQQRSNEAQIREQDLNAKLEKSRKESDEIIKRLETEAGNIRGEAHELHEQLERKVSELQEASARDLDAAHAENAELQSQCAKLASKLEKAEADRDSLASQLAQSQKDAARKLELEQEGTGKELQDLLAQLNLEKEERGRVQLELNLSVELTERLQKQVEDLGKEAREQEARIAALEGTLEAERQKVRHMEEEDARRLKEYEKVQKTCSLLQQEVDRHRSGLDDGLLGLGGELEEVKAELTRKELQFVEEIGEERERCRQINRKLDVEKEKSAELERELDSVKETLAEQSQGMEEQAQKKIAEVRERQDKKYAQIMKEHQLATENLKCTHEEEVRAFQDNIHMLEGQIADLEESVALKCSEMNELEEALQELELEKGRELAALEDQKLREIKRLEDEKKQAIVALQAEHKEEIARLVQAHREKITQVDTEGRTLRAFVFSTAKSMLSQVKSKERNLSSSQRRRRGSDSDLDDDDEELFVGEGDVVDSELPNGI